MIRVVFLLVSLSLFACTDFVLQAKDGGIVNGRSLEFAQDLRSILKVFPRNQKMTSLNPQKGRGIEWVSKYGYVGVTPLGMDLSFDGLNEKGLSFGYLWLPGFTEYPTVSPEQMGQALDFVNLGAWLLGNFATVAEAREALSKVVIWGHIVPSLGLPPVHAAIHDASGNNLVVEFVGGAMKVYENPIGVLTNSPPFDWQLTNLQNYLNLNATNADSIMLKGVTINPTGQGSGFLGIPGDWSPPSRFVKMATYLRFAKQAPNSRDAVNQAEHFLNTVDIPLGEIREKGKETGDYTQWIVIKDLTQGKFYFRSYNDLSLKMVDLKRIHFEKMSNKTLPIDLAKGNIDVTDSLKN